MSNLPFIKVIAIAFFKVALCLLSIQCYHFDILTVVVLIKSQVALPATHNDACFVNKSVLLLIFLLLTNDISVTISDSWKSFPLSYKRKSFRGECNQRNHIEISFEILNKTSH